MFIDEVVRTHKLSCLRIYPLPFRAYFLSTDFGAAYPLTQVTSLESNINQ